MNDVLPGLNSERESVLNGPELDTQHTFSRDGCLPGLRQGCYLPGGSRKDGERGSGALAVPVIQRLLPLCGDQRRREDGPHCSWPDSDKLSLSLWDSERLICFIIPHQRLPHFHSGADDFPWLLHRKCPILLPYISSEWELCRG